MTAAFEVTNKVLLRHYLTTYGFPRERCACGEETPDRKILGWIERHQSDEIVKALTETGFIMTTAEVEDILTYPSEKEQEDD